MITSEQPNVKPASKYTITETCNLLGIHRNTLRSYVKAGYIKVNDKIQSQRFKGSEILRFWNTYV